MPYLSYLSVFCPAAPTENASIQHERANTPREPRPRAWVRPRSCSRPTCRLRRRFDKPRSRAPSSPPSSPGLSLYASLYIHIIPIPRDRTTYRCTTDDTSIHVTEHREETGYFDAKDIRVESKRKRNGTAVRYEFGPRRTEATSKERERERGNRSHGETWPRCGLYLKDGRGGSRSYVRTYVARRAVRSRIVK